VTPVAVLTTPTGGGADVDPVGGSVGGPTIPAGIDKGFKQKWSKMIPLFPIGGKAVDDQGENMGGEMLHLNFRTDEKPAVVDDLGKIRRSGGVIPADENISSFHPPGSGTEGEPSYYSIAATVDEIADLGSTQRPGLEGVIPIHEGIPHQGVVSVFAGDGKTGDGPEIFE